MDGACTGIRAESAVDVVRVVQARNDTRNRYAASPNVRLRKAAPVRADHAAARSWSQNRFHVDATHASTE